MKAPIGFYLDSFDDDFVGQADISGRTADKKFEFPRLYYPPFLHRAEKRKCISV
jgi:hypothetical protein